ncbi:MAG: hypothetical protein R3324_18555, partial [Halobacteriales archaeon]|nr:hypothetical protein [Halobacteriales archaeon]
TATPSATPADVEPGLVGASSTGGRCVEDPSHGLDITSSREAGVRTVVVRGNLTVPGAHYVVESFAVTTVGPSTYRLDVNTTEDPRKAPRPCPDGGVVTVEATVELPATGAFELRIHQDGELLSGIGTGPES